MPMPESKELKIISPQMVFLILGLYQLSLYKLLGLFEVSLALVHYRIIPIGNNLTDSGPLVGIFIYYKSTHRLGTAS